MNQEAESRARALRIAILAMIGGLFAFLCVAVALVDGGMTKPDPKLTYTLLLVLAAVAIGDLVGYVVLRSVMTRGTQPGDAKPNSVNRFVTLTIVGCAMAEGLGLLGTVTFLLTGNRLGLVAAVLGILLIAAQWPTQAKLAAYVSD